MNEMSRFELYSRDLAFLSKHVTDQHIRQRLASAEPRGDRSSRFVVLLSEEDRLGVLDDLGRVLSEIGLQEDSEPNSTGHYIETLIDTFNVEA
jgi:hypothetical protein